MVVNFTEGKVGGLIQNGTSEVDGSKKAQLRCIYENFRKIARPILADNARFENFKNAPFAIWDAHGRDPEASGRNHADHGHALSALLRVLNF